MPPPDEIAPPASAHPGNSAGSDLCRDCGLCCDGSLFDGVDLGGEEVDAAAANGLRPIAGPDGAQFRLPCPRFIGICGIYPGRPLRCRQYSCHLLARFEAGEVDEASAHAIVAEAIRLAGAADALAEPAGNRAAARRRWERDFKAMTGDRAGDASGAEPRWLLAMTAYQYFLDRHFRKPGRERLKVGAKPEMMAGDA